MENIIKLIQDALSNISPHKLAYLAATSKPEAFVRDEIAYLIHTNTNYVALREKTCGNSPNSKRIDLAIYQHDNVKPLALIELKAMIAADAITSKPHDLILQLSSDLEKIHTIPAGEHIGIMIVAHSTRANKYHRYFKYGEDDHSLHERNISIEETIERTTKHFSANSKFTIERGNTIISAVWENPVSVDFIIIKMTV